MINTIMVGLLTCGLIASAMAYGELKQWQGLTVVLLYGVSGLMAAELVAAPIIWDLFGLKSGIVESLSMSCALSVGLHRVCKLVRGNDEQEE